MATTAPNCPGTAPRPTHSCVRCAERKVSRKLRCDRKTPCTACTRHAVDCQYNTLHPPRSRRKRPTNQLLTERLKHYEALLRDKGIDPSEWQRVCDAETASRTCQTGVGTAGIVPPQTQSDIELEPSESPRKLQVITDQGRSRVVDNALWTGMVDEFHFPQDALGDLSGDETDPAVSDDDYVLPIGHRPGRKNGILHPPQDDIHQFWDVFVKNVDPLTKVVHVPTTQPAIEKAAMDIEAVPRGFQALMFAIYSAAVMSIPDEECASRFGKPRRYLLAMYTSATKAALTRAGFMGTTSLVVLQALILHLLAVRDVQEPRVVWSLTGVAVRIAQSMGLERDGIHLGLSPFETEIRRRIWWQLKIHDFRTAELCGIGKFQDLHTSEESTKWPTNINDDQIFPSMDSPAINSAKLTDFVFIALKCELLKFAASRVADLRQQGQTSKPWDPQPLENNFPETDKISRDIEELLEAKYLRYCDPSQPLHLITTLMARCSLNIIRFMAHHPRRWVNRAQTPAAEREVVWDICIRLLEQHGMLQSSPQLKQFAWQAPYTQQWHAIIHVLDTLRAEPKHREAERAWQLIDGIYKHNPDMTYDMRKPIHVAVGNLCLKAYSRCWEAQADDATRVLPTPEFIALLREQRESNGQRKRKQHTIRAQSTSPPFDAQTGMSPAAVALIPGADSDLPKPDDGPIQSQLSDFSSALDPSRLDADSAWLAYGFEECQPSDIADESLLNLDLALDYDNDMDGVTYDVSWDQWDSWLTTSNLIGPFITLNDRDRGP